MQLLAIVDAVRTTGPDQWRDTNSHDSMHGSCEHLHEARDKHGQMLYRLYLLWQRNHKRVVIIDGGVKPNSTALPDSFYDDLAAFAATADGDPAPLPSLTTLLGRPSRPRREVELRPGERISRRRTVAYRRALGTVDACNPSATHFGLRCNPFATAKPLLGHRHLPTKPIHPGFRRSA
jgi:hypothetical protein